VAKGDGDQRSKHRHSKGACDKPTLKDAAGPKNRGLPLMGAARALSAILATACVSTTFAHTAMVWACGQCRTDHHKLFHGAFLLLYREYKNGARRRRRNDIPRRLLVLPKHVFGDEGVLRAGLVRVEHRDGHAYLADLPMRVATAAAKFLLVLVRGAKPSLTL
jgi:hypothetical protein